MTQQPADTSPEDRELEALARAAGLGPALALFRDDLVRAMRDVANQRRVLQDWPPLAPSDEPWPPMRVGPLG